jgi:hypothetical protein
MAVPTRWFTVLIVMVLLLWQHRHLGVCTLAPKRVTGSDPCGTLPKFSVVQFLEDWYLVQTGMLLGDRLKFRKLEHELT